MNTLSIEIRPALRDDAAGVAAVHRQSWFGAYRGLIPHDQLRRMVDQRGQAWWEEAIGRSAGILVVEFGTEIVGYSTFGRNRAPELPQRGEIYEIYLMPHYQGVGIGSRLFATVRERLSAAGLPGTVVWALEDNHIATEFYASRGGHDVAEGSERFGACRLKKIAFVWP